ncbi:MAG: hypothetical protein ACMUIA_08820 [bacterium]
MKREAPVPAGETQFNVQVAGLHFRAGHLDFLEVAGAKARYQGTGTISGKGNYGFMITVIDEALTPGKDKDLLLKIRSV